MGSPPWTKTSIKPDQFNLDKPPSKEQGLEIGDLKRRK
jgi:hypothetical protein